MVETPERTPQSTDRSAADWSLLALRLAVATLVAGPAVSKFLTHGRSVEFFAGLGLPFPTAMVLVVGVLEVAAVAMLVLGVGDDLAALSLVPVMLVAIAAVGPDWKNLAVLGGALAVVALRHERVRRRYRSAAAAVSPS